MLFQGDASTRGSRCLVLLNVRDFSVVTPCRMVEKGFHFTISYLLYPQLEFVRHFSKCPLLEAKVNKYLYIICDVSK